MGSKLYLLRSLLNFGKSMHNYKAPLIDMKFLLSTQSKTDHSELLMVLDEAAKLAEHELDSANRLGDQDGCRFDSGKVSLPDSTKQAFKAYVDGGWMGITMPESYGGQELPETIGSKIGEMLTSSNHALSMMSALTMSACKALIAFGSEDLKQNYLPNMVSGKWTGTMCMTEPHCGSDLGLIVTGAVAVDEQRYEITGNKIFISAVEHDASENIIHLVLARIKGALTGTKGLSLFLVPKILPASGEENNVHCVGIEEKMGIHANPTCTMSFEGATGYLVGKPNEGIKAMFTMMNEMRLGTALQGVGLSEHAFQKSYTYAIDRTQGKSLSKEFKSEQPADPLIQHTDVRRMLLTQKAFAESGRALCHYCAELLDATKLEDDDAKQAEKLLGLLTPIAKAFLTETGLESASNAIQVYGGHGYISENGVEQLYRDGRIATLYEGTTGIQSLDLLGRKVLGDQAQTLLMFTKQIYKLCKSILENEQASEQLKQFAAIMSPYASEWPRLAQQVGMKAFQDHDEVGAVAYDFLMYSGYVSLGFFWLKLALSADLSVAGFSPDFLSGKLKTAHFYFDRILPRCAAHKSAIESGKQSLTALDDGEWCFT